MSSLNRRFRNQQYFSDSLTHEGAPAAGGLTIEQKLRRVICSCLLWEDTFYESGKDIGDRIVELVNQASPGVVARLAIEARQNLNLRHAPLLLTAALAKTGSGSSLVSDTLTEVIQRADELTEFVAIYAKLNGVAPNNVKKKLSAQVKRGLARAVGKFDQYQLTKYNRDGAVRLRDVVFLSHHRPEHGGLIANLVNKTFFPKQTKSSGFPVTDTYSLDGVPHVSAPDTWEVNLSAGADKKETFEKLLREQKLGYLAVLRNLRGMMEAGVDRSLVHDVILARKGAQRVLPFRYVTAARACPQLESVIDRALLAAINDLSPLPGKTIVLVDVSGSMNSAISSRPTYRNNDPLTRLDAAATLASIIPGDDVRVFTFSERLVEVPARKGMAGIDVIRNSQPHSSTYLGHAVSVVNKQPHDRLIVITDEQSHDPVPSPQAKFAYMINVASYQNGVGYNYGWTHVDGFSEQVLRFIVENEKLAQ